ncbi:MAG: ABC transporter ATP-binding protein [Phycisphaerae bacterium]|nr:ABC transporter ATP-binding protein [Phycisphaerae bacterium]
MIVAHELRKRFGEVVAVDRLSFEIPRGSVCGFLGPNGAGKTTTLRMLAGLLAPDGGRLEIDGLDAIARSRDARRRLGYLPDGAPAYPEMRVEEYLRFRWRIAGRTGSMRTEIDAACGACALGGVRRRLIGTLSRGFRQRVGLAAAILGRPPVLLLDEPTEGLDPFQVREFRGLVREFAQGRTVLLSSHLLAEVETICDRVILMLGGRLVASGTVESLRRGGSARIECEVRGAAAVEAIAVLSGVRQVRPMTEPDESGWRRVEVLAAEGDPREAIAAAVGAAGGRLRELVRREESLEETFMRLAGEERR